MATEWLKSQFIDLHLNNKHRTIKNLIKFQQIFQHLLDKLQTNSLVYYI